MPHLYTCVSAYYGILHTKLGILYTLRDYKVRAYICVDCLARWGSLGSVLLCIALLGSAWLGLSNICVLRLHSSRSSLRDTSVAPNKCKTYTLYTNLHSRIKCKIYTLYINLHLRDKCIIYTHYHNMRIYFHRCN